jgi:hypothetical protein
MLPALVNDGSLVVRDFLDRRLANFLYRVLLIREWRGEYNRDNQVPQALSFWGDPTLDALLLSLLPDMERVSDCTLVPTYCYARLYLHGNRLERHRDRQACEVAATIHLGHSGAAPPPICLAPNHAVDQEPGDAVVYLGSEVEHWRETFLGTNFGQVFLNYVRDDGPQRHHAFDGRLAMFPEALRPVPVPRAADTTQRSSTR